MSNKAKRPAVRVYAAGGAGINLGHAMKSAEATEGDKERYSEFNISFIDTSRQNFLNKDIDIEKEAYIFLGGASDGSGGIRKTNFELVKNTYHEVFKKFPPADINIVLFGTSGGSGSAIAPVLVKHLIESDRPTILVAVGSVDTLTFATNTKNTLASLQGISKVTGKPVILYYCENDPNWIEEKVNEQIISNVSLISTLLSGAADSIDRTDISNWLNYTRVSDQPASLTALTILTNDTPMPDTVQPFTCLSIHRHDKLPPRGENLDFRKVGYLDDLTDNINSLHFFLDKPSVEDNFKRIDAIVTSLKQISESRKADFSFADGADDDGFVM